MKGILTAFLCMVFMQGFSQQPIFTTIPGGDLYSWDLSNCTYRFVGSTGQSFMDIAFTDDGRLWGVAFGNLYQIDTTTANTTLIGSMGIQGAGLVALNDSVLLMEDNLSLYGINTSNASVYLIGAVGYQACGDLTWYDHNLYMTTCDQLIQIVLNSSNSAVLSSTAINSVNNPIPTCEGIATASFIGLKNSIIGFSGNHIYKICQFDGSFQLYCTTELYGTPGAASIKLPIQNPLPASCDSITGIAPTPTQPVQRVWPNPVGRNASLNIDLGESQSLPITIQLFNLQGEILLTQKMFSSTNQVKLDLADLNLASGSYIVEVNSPSSYKHTLLIVE